MPAMNPAAATLVLIDFQARLMPAIAGADAVLGAAAKLVAAARSLDIAMLATEQSPEKLGATVLALPCPALAKTGFDACTAPGFLAALPPEGDIVLCGAEAHICVAQTALGLLERGRRVFVVADAVGSRSPADKQVGLDRLARNGAEIVSTEMVLFEWLGNADHPAFREISKLIR